MKVAFTGTRDGIPELQLLGAIDLLKAGDELHFGDCQGADAQAWWLAASRGIRTVAHPAIDDTWRAYCQADFIHAPKAYMERNRAMVNECEYLIATPRSFHEILRSGTWATIRYAMACGKNALIIGPDGKLGHMVRANRKRKRRHK